MLSGCVKAVDWCRETSGKLDYLSAESTDSKKYLTSQVFLCAFWAQVFRNLIGLNSQSFGRFLICLDLLFTHNPLPLLIQLS